MDYNRLPRRVPNLQPGRWALVETKELFDGTLLEQQCHRGQGFIGSNRPRFWWLEARLKTLDARWSSHQVSDSIWLYSLVRRPRPFVGMVESPSLGEVAGLICGKSCKQTEKHMRMNVISWWNKSLKHSMCLWNKWEEFPIFPPSGDSMASGAEIFVPWRHMFCWSLYVMIAVFVGLNQSNPSILRR